MRILGPELGAPHSFELTIEDMHLLAGTGIASELNASNAGTRLQLGEKLFEAIQFKRAPLSLPWRDGRQLAEAIASKMEDGSIPPNRTEDLAVTILGTDIISADLDKELRKGTTECADRPLDAAKLMIQNIVDLDVRQQ